MLTPRLSGCAEQWQLCLKPLMRGPNWLFWWGESAHLDTNPEGGLACSKCMIMLFFTLCLISCGNFVINLWIILFFVCSLNTFSGAILYTVTAEKMRLCPKKRVWNYTLLPFFFRTRRCRESGFWKYKKNNNKKKPQSRSVKMGKMGTHLSRAEVSTSLTRGEKETDLERRGEWEILLNHSERLWEHPCVCVFSSQLCRFNKSRKSAQIHTDNATVPHWFKWTKDEKRKLCPWIHLTGPVDEGACFQNRAHFCVSISSAIVVTLSLLHPKYQGGHMLQCGARLWPESVGLSCFRSCRGHKGLFSQLRRSERAMDEWKL